MSALAGNSHPSIGWPHPIVLNFGFREWVLLQVTVTHRFGDHAPSCLTLAFERERSCSSHRLNLLSHSSALSSVKAPPLSSQSFHSDLHVVLVLSGGTHVDMGLSLISNDCNLPPLIVAVIYHYRCDMSLTDFEWSQFALFDCGRYFSSSINVRCYSG